MYYLSLQSVGSKRRMCHGIRTHIRTFLPLLTVLFNYFIYRSVLRHLRFYMVEPFPQSRLAENSFKLFITDPQEKLLLPNRFTKLCILLKEYFRLHCHRVNISRLIVQTSNFFFWLIFLVSSSSSLTTLRFPYSSSINTNLGKFSKFSTSSISKRFSSFSTIITFSQNLSSSVKP